MNGTNLFEQQAHLQRLATERSGAARPEISMLPVLRFIEGANLEQCGKVAVHLSARLYTLEKHHSGMQAANLDEAAHLTADAALDIEGALRLEAPAPCRCGRCDDCIAARSDERHHRRQDALAACA